MAVSRNGNGHYLALMPPADDAPKEPKCYQSPAKPFLKKECSRVQRVPSIERLVQQAALELEAASTPSAKDAEDPDADDEDGASVYTYKKSQYWSKEVEEKLGLGGADPYGLLELEERRWRASADEIRKAYRRLVLTLHPDKKQSEEASKGSPKKAKAKAAMENVGEEGGEEEAAEEEDTEFKLLSAAWDLLGSNESRRAYDSIDNFNDYLPTTFNAKKSGGRTFYQVFSAPFARQAKFSTQPGAPALGDEETPIEQVNKFYKFWFGFVSWRDFGLLAEHDYKEAEDREERRWMQRQNKNFTDRIKKDERQRVAAFVQLAYDNDPRILAVKEEKAAEKARVKEEKEAAVRAKKEAVEAEQQAKQDAEKAQREAAEAAKAAEKALGADAKREKEKQRSALKKARKEFKALGESGWGARASDLDVVAAMLDLGALQELSATLAAGVSDEATAALDAAVKVAMKQ